MRKLLIFLCLLLIAGCSTAVSKEKVNELTVIAHRGASSTAPENTLPAYAKAVELGADYIEIDLWKTQDNQLVAFHDIPLERITGAKGRVSEYTLAEIKQMDAGSWFSDDYKGERIPTLNEIFDRFGRSTKYYIESRTVNGELVMEEALLELLESYKLTDRVIIQSYSPDSLKKIHSMNQDIPLVQLSYEKDLSKIRENQIKEYAIGVGVIGSYVDKEFVKRMHAANLVVHPFFGVNEKEVIEDVVSYGVDGVISDHLDHTMEIKENIKNSRAE